MNEINAISVAVWTLVVLGAFVLSVFVIAAIVYRINKVSDLNREGKNLNSADTEIIDITNDLNS